MEISSGTRLECKSLEALPAIATQLLAFAGNQKVFAFFGEMGSGKTTLIKELCLQIGVADLVSSPTFTIVNEYLANADEPVYHFDFYRIKSETEAFDLGFENYLYSGNFCFIEWPEKIINLLPESYVRILIESNGEERILTMNI